MRSPYTHAAGHEELMLLIGDAATATGKTEARLKQPFAANEANEPKPTTPENYQYPNHNRSMRLPKLSTNHPYGL